MPETCAVGAGTARGRILGGGIVCLGYGLVAVERGNEVKSLLGLPTHPPPNPPVGTGVFRFSPAIGMKIMQLG